MNASENVASSQVDSGRVDALRAEDLDPIPGMSENDRLRFHLLLLSHHPKGIAVMAHLYESSPSLVIRSSMDVQKLHDRQRERVVEQLIAIGRTSVPTIGE